MHPWKEGGMDPHRRILAMALLAWGLARLARFAGTPFSDGMLD